MPTSLPEHFEDFAEARREGFLKVKELKDKGEKICGAFCQYTPSEIIYAAGLYQVALCGRSPDPIKTAETRLPANLLSSHQSKLRTCPGRKLPICLFLRCGCR